MKPRAAPIFSATATSSAALVALVTVTCTARATVFYTDVRCICNRRVLMGIPGVVQVKVRRIATTNDRSGRGRTVYCKSCSSLVEIIEHG